PIARGIGWGRRSAPRSTRTTPNLLLDNLPPLSRGSSRPDSRRLPWAGSTLVGRVRWRRWQGVESEPALATRVGHCTRPVWHAELVEDRRQVVLDRLLAQPKGVRDLAISRAASGPDQDLELARGERIRRSWVGDHRIAHALHAPLEDLANARAEHLARLDHDEPNGILAGSTGRLASWGQGRSLLGWVARISRHPRTRMGRAHDPKVQFGGNAFVSRQKGRAAAQLLGPADGSTRK